MLAAGGVRAIDTTRLIRYDGSDPIVLALEGEHVRVLGLLDAEGRAECRKRCMSRTSTASEQAPTPATATATALQHAPAGNDGSCIFDISSFCGN